MKAHLLKSLCLLTVAALAAWSSACSSGKNPGGATSRIVFRDSQGRQLAEADLADASGSFKWEVIGSGSVPAKAMQLHEEGRKAGSTGDHEKALALFTQAHQAAPDWPYPVYDAAFTYLLKGDAAKAMEQYALVDKMSPGGYFTVKTALDCLQREKSGDLKPGMYALLVSLEWEQDRGKKKSMLEQMVKQFPKFPAAWKELALLEEEDDERKLALIQTGLSHAPDGETKGVLLINKALVLSRTGKLEEAKQILGELALSPDSTLSTQHLAKATLKIVLKQQ